MRGEGAHAGSRVRSGTRGAMLLTDSNPRRPVVNTTEIGSSAANRTTGGIDLEVEAVTRHELSSQWMRTMNNLTHWGYGISTGAPLGIVTNRIGSRKLRYGLPFGAGVWATGYVVLPLFGVYRPIWEYDLVTLGKDLGAHLVYGTATAAALRVLP